MQQETMKGIVLEMAEQKLSVTAMIDATGLSRGSIYKMLADLGIPRPRVGRPRTSNLIEIETRTGRSIDQLLAAMAKKGWTVTEAAKRLGVTRSYIHYLCKKHDVTLAPRATKTTPTSDLTLGDITLTLGEWAEKLGLSPSQLRYRLRTWPHENILSGKNPERKPRTKRGETT